MATLISSNPPATSEQEPPLPLHVPILLFIDASWEFGGSAIYSSLLAEQLVSSGYKVFCICYPDDAVRPMRENLASLGCQVYTAREGHWTLRGRLVHFRFLAETFRRHKRGALLLLMGNFVQGGMVALAARLAGITTIVRADLQSPVPPVSWSQRMSMRVRDAFLHNAVVVGSQENVDAFAAISRKRAKLNVVHTGIALERFQSQPDDDGLRRELGLPSEATVVGTVSRLSEPRKGVHHFLEMAQLIKDSFPLARFLVVGDGPQRAELERYASQLGLGQLIVFAGWRSDIPRVLGAMNVFVMPSLQEGGPSSVLEAMAAGLPVVATRVGMVPEVIDQGHNGLIVGPGETTAMAQAVLTLLQDANLRQRLGQNARRTAFAQFSIETMAANYLRLLGTLWRSKNSS